MKLDFFIYKWFLLWDKSSMKSVAFKVAMISISLLLFLNISSIYFIFVSLNWFPKVVLSKRLIKISIFLLILMIYFVYRNKESAIVGRYAAISADIKKKYDLGFWIYIMCSIILFILSVVLRYYEIHRQS